MLINLIDGGVKDIESDSWCNEQGCSTCGYGSSYINEYVFKMSDNTTIRVEANNEYSYAFSDGHMMKAILQNLDTIKMLTISEFKSWLQNTLSEDGAEVTVS